MEPKKFLVSGFLSGILIFVIWMIVLYLVQIILPYDALKLGGMRSADDPIMLLFFLHPWVIGFAMALIYPYFGESIIGDYILKGRIFGLLAWLVSSVPSIFIIYTSMDYPTGFTVGQIVSSLIYMLLAGVTIAKIYEW